MGIGVRGPKINKINKNRIFGFFAPDGRWEDGDSLKILSRGVGTFSTPGEAIPRIFEKSIFLWIFLKSSVRGRGAASGGIFSRKISLFIDFEQNHKDAGRTSERFPGSIAPRSLF